MYRFIIVIAIMVLYSCNHAPDKTGKADSTVKKATDTSTAIAAMPLIDTFALNDVDSDKINDTAFVINPKFRNGYDPSEGCIDKTCGITVRFSNKFSSFSYDNCIGGMVFNIGDIDEDGNNEIMFIPSMPIGCWGQMHFYSLSRIGWKDFGEATGYLCADEDISKRVKKISRSMISVTEDYSTAGDDAKIEEREKKIFLKR